MTKQQRKRLWAPDKGFKGAIISEHGVRSLQEELEREGWAQWAAREVEPFEVIPPMPSQVWKRGLVRTFISQCLP